ncbi:MAG: PAS domain S-box protein [Deltaproteobacteria bacterium]|nr:PAS domain S-box protein [Deltaproteobacteria bacterium]
MNASTFKLIKSPLGLISLKSSKKPKFETKAIAETRDGIPDSMVLAVIFIACIYWVLDSILNIFFENKFNLIAELIGPDLYDIYLRVIVLCLFVMFGSHAQSIINKLRDAKQKLNDSEELWRSLVATAPDVITAVDQKGVIRFVNQDIFELPREKAIGQSIYKFLPEKYRYLARESIESVFETGESESFEVRMGTRRRPTWYAYRIGALKLGRQVIAATIISSNITEFKQAEELKRYKELFDNVTDGVFLINRKGKFIESNDRVLKSTGYTKVEFLDLNITQIVEADQIPYVESMLTKVSQEEEARFELNIKTKTSTIIPNEVNCRYVSYLGKPCFLAVARDITETKLLQNQLLRSERLAATGQLAASIAHEINSPLQGITALLSVIRMAYEKDEDLLNKLDLIKNAFVSIRNTVRNLIDLNRPGKEKKQPMDVNQVIENTVALMSSHLKKNMVDVKLNLAATTTQIKASPQQIGQVIMNLVNNAVEAIVAAPDFEEKLKKFSSIGGEIVIDTSIQDEKIIITLSDSGPGISNSDLEYIFDPFFTRKKIMGLGVGLSICYGIIEDHQGTITAENSPDGGVVFTINLPLG